MAVPKVLHIGNTANVAAELRDGLAELRAAECLVFETHNNRLHFAEDVRFTWDWISSGVRRLERNLAYTLLLKSLLDEADLLHLHTSGRVAFACLRWAHARGKPVVQHFHGEELRLGRVVEEARGADAILVATPDLLQYLPSDVPSEKATWMPNPRKFPGRPIPPRDKRQVRIVHAYLANASYVRVFGTPAIRDAVRRLQGKGYDVVLDEVSGVPHGEALLRYQDADIAVDKLRVGWYGTFAIECLALGLPSLAGIRPDLKRLDAPVVAVTEETLVDTLEPLVASPSFRASVGAELFAKARALHDTTEVARRLAAVYHTLLQ